jgi:hypothetical protein
MYRFKNDVRVVFTESGKHKMTNRIRKRTSVIDNIRTWTNKRQRNIDNMLVNPATIIKYVREYGRGNQLYQLR